MSFTCRSIDRGKIENFSLVCFIILPSRSLWKRHADVFNVFSQCLSFAFNGIISHRPAIKSIFSWSPSLHYGHTASYKIHQKLIEKKLLPFFSSSLRYKWAIVIYRWATRERQKNKLYYFFNHFPIRKILQKLTNRLTETQSFEDEKKVQDWQKNTKSLLFCSEMKKRKLRFVWTKQFLGLRM